MAVKNRRSLHGFGIFQKQVQIIFYIVPVAMGHVDSDTANIIAKDLMGSRRTPKPVSVTGNLVHPDMGIFFRQSNSIIIVIAQMHDGIRLHSLHALAHKAH